MQIGVGNDEIVKVFQENYPKEYTIVVLSIINEKQGNLIAELQATVAELKPEEEKPTDPDAPTSQE